MDKKLVELLDQIQKGTQAVVPDVLDSVLRWVQMTAIIHLVFAALALILCVTALAICGKNYEKWRSQAVDIGEGGEFYVSAALCATVCGVFMLLALFVLLDASAWVSAIDPKAGLVGRLVDKWGL